MEDYSSRDEDSSSAEDVGSDEYDLDFNNIGKKRNYYGEKRKWARNSRNPRSSYNDEGTVDHDHKSSRFESNGDTERNGNDFNTNTKKIHQSRIKRATSSAPMQFVSASGGRPERLGELGDSAGGDGDNANSIESKYSNAAVSNLSSPPSPPPFSSSAHTGKEYIPTQPRDTIPSDLGAWQKHTTGIGLKYLQKFGFKGRLGKHETGIARAIEANGSAVGIKGIGYGSTQSRKAPAQYSPADLNDTPQQTEKQQQKKQKSKAKVIATKTNVESILQAMMESAAVGDVGTENGSSSSSSSSDTVQIIDMRAVFSNQEAEAPSTNIGTDVKRDASSKSSTHTPSPPQVGQELLYNVSMAAQELEGEVQVVARAATAAHIRYQNLSNEIRELNAEKAAQSPRLSNVTAFRAALLEMQIRLSGRKSSDKNDGENITSEWIVKSVGDLFKSFPQEFRLYGIVDMLPSLLAPILQRTCHSWKPLENPRAVLLHFCGIFEPLLDILSSTTIVSRSGSATDINSNDSLHRYQRDKALEDQVLEWRVQLVIDHFMPVIRRELYQWIPNEDNLMCGHTDTNSPAITVLNTLLNVGIPRYLIEELYDDCILPKLNEALSSWDPRLLPAFSGSSNSNHNEVSQVELPITKWLLPWQAVLDEDRFSSFFPEIRQKLSIFLSHTGVDYHLQTASMVEPWVTHTYWNASSGFPILLRAVIPRLIHKIRQCFRNITDFSEYYSSSDCSVTDAIRIVCSWQSLLNQKLVTAILVGEVFPYWLRLLEKMLYGPVTGTSMSLMDKDQIHSYYWSFRNILDNETLRSLQINLKPQTISGRGNHDMFYEWDRSLQTGFAVALAMISEKLHIEASRAAINPGCSRVLEQSPFGRTGAVHDFFTAWAFFGFGNMEQTPHQILSDDIKGANLAKDAKVRNIGIARNDLKPAQGTTTFVDVVERYSESLGYSLELQPSKYHHGHQLYKIGKCSVYVLQGVLYVRRPSIDTKTAGVGYDGNNYGSSSHDSKSKPQAQEWIPTAVSDLSKYV
eukprot:GSChrysophyteH1.ASY1.ANO1.3016.1 assembled CDS